jgi:hypothetical protein
MAKDPIDRLAEMLNLDMRVENGFVAIAEDVGDLDYKFTSLRATTERPPLPRRASAAASRRTQYTMTSGA